MPEPRPVRDPGPSDDVPEAEPLGEDLEIEAVVEIPPRPHLAREDDLWRRLRPGDRVRFEELPAEFLDPSVELAPRTLAVYRHLVTTGAVLTVQHVDPEDELPWTEFRWARDGGRAEHHYLALNHGGIALVEGA